MNAYKFFHHSCDACGAQLWKKAYNAVFDSLAYGYQDEVQIACDCGAEYRILIEWGIKGVKFSPQLSSEKCPV